MSKTIVDNRGTLSAELVEVRGPSGRLYGRLNRETLQLEVKRKNDEPELIDLRPLLAPLLMPREA